MIDDDSAFWEWFGWAAAALAAAVIAFWAWAAWVKDHYGFDVMDG